MKTRITSSKSEENQSISQGRSDGEENIQDKQNNKRIIKARTFVLEYWRLSFSVVTGHFL